MSEVLNLQLSANGDYCLSGELDRDTVPPFWRRRTEWLPKDSLVNLDLAAVNRIDSAGMAMLLHLQQQLTLNHQSLAINNAPSQLKLLLELSNVERLFIKTINYRE